MICCICKQKINGHGHNPDPVPTEWPEQRCCDICNAGIVIPMRLELAMKEKNEEDESK